MNDRIEDLIVSYLHRGCTPDEEKELFEACKNHPEASSLLRQHIVLSLKLRQLREKSEVPLEVRNALITRINEMPPQPEEVPTRQEERSTRFGWLHLTGASLVGATAVAVLFLLSKPEPQPIEPLMADRPQTDTVLLSRVDTVIQFRPAVVPRSKQVASQNSPAPLRTVMDADSRGISQVQEGGTNDTSAGLIPPLDQRDIHAAPILLDKKPHALADIKQPSYLEQYQTMVSTLEKVTITMNDKVRN